MTATVTPIVRGLRNTQPPPMIGESPVMLELRRTIERLASARAPMLITGETGTGKELVAHLLHEKSDRADGPFVAVNCAALPASLFQAEVFGYEKGAFTGAYRRNIGRIEAASGGTLFLDEIGDLAPDMQAILLRFLEDGVFERLGSVEPIQADVRIVAATHTELEAACREGLFREDLFYRLNALHLLTPPLRERGPDVQRLAEHFLTTFNRELGLSRAGFEPQALERLSTHHWPGNIRELRNRIRQAAVMGEGRLIGVADLGLEQRMRREANGERAPLTLREARDIAEQRAIEGALRSSAGAVPQAAKLLAISRAQLYRLVERHGLSALLR